MTFAPPWSLPGWLSGATEWITHELGERGIRVTGPIEQPHVRQWSTVLRVPTSGGTVYFKACGSTLAGEPGVVQQIAQWQPDLILPLLAVDVARGWRLMPDGGERLRTVIQADLDRAQHLSFDDALEHWRKLLPRYAQLQIESARHIDQLISAGALDRRLAIFPDLYENLISDRALLRVGLPDGISRDEEARLHRLAPSVAEMCRTLAAYGVPEALDHSDLHDGNVLYRDGRYCIFDWGDACITHPFCSLNVILAGIENTLGPEPGVGIENVLGVEPQVPRVDELVDIYLAQWTRFESREHLRRAAELAQRIGMVNRALTYQNVLSKADENVRMQYGMAIPEWLREFIKSNGESE